MSDHMCVILVQTLVFCLFIVNSVILANNLTGH